MVVIYGYSRYQLLAKLASLTNCNLKEVWYVSYAKRGNEWQTQTTKHRYKTWYSDLV
jgi:hypothetical protein